MSLTWREALWGYERQLVDWNFLSALASVAVDSGEFEPEELALCATTKYDSSEAGRLARKLADSEPVISNSQISKKWLYLVLRGVYRNFHELSDPLNLLEHLYDSFEQPSELAEIVSAIVLGKPQHTASSDCIEHVFKLLGQSLDHPLKGGPS